MTVEVSAAAADAAFRNLLTDLTAPAPAAVAARLGMTDLPARIAALAAGMLYGVVCDEQAVRLPLLSGALVASAEAGAPCALLTPADPAILLLKARLSGFPLEDKVRSGALAIYRLDAEAGKHLFRLGPEAFVRQLERSFPDRGFIAIDQADTLFMLSDPGASLQAAQAYAQWIAARQHSALAMFSAAAGSPREFLTLRHIAQNFAGFAIVSPAAGGAVFDIRHWFGAEGASPRELIPVRWDRAGLFGAGARSALDEDLPPMDSVVAVRGALQSVDPAWQGWQEAETVEAALEVARSRHSAMIVLPFHDAAQYESLGKAIAAVRAMRRDSLRVLIRERGVRLRAVQAVSLMRVGASAIVPADVPDLAAKRLIDALLGTRFARPYDPYGDCFHGDAAALRRRVMPTRAEFAAAVETMIASTDGFDVEHSLVRLDPVYVAPASLVSRATRLGRDLIGLADTSSAWLFFFGCPPRTAEALMKRLFMTPLAELCRSWTVEHDPARMLSALPK